MSQGRRARKAVAAAARRRRSVLVSEHVDGIDLARYVRRRPRDLAALSPPHRRALAEAVGELDVLVDNAGVALDGFDADVGKKMRRET